MSVRGTPCSCARVVGRAAPREELNALFDEFDVDGSGVLDREEMDAYASQKAAESPVVPTDHQSTLID